MQFLDDFNFEIVNFPFLDGDVPRSPSYGIYISHTGQCKRTGGCYNELVVAFFSTGGGVKGKKSIPVDFIIYL